RWNEIVARKLLRHWTTGAFFIFANLQGLSASAHLEQMKLVIQPSLSRCPHNHSSYPGSRRWPQSQTNHSPFQTSVLSRLIGAPTKNQPRSRVTQLPLRATHGAAIDL